MKGRNIMRQILGSMGVVALTVLSVPAFAQDNAAGPATETQPPSGTEPAAGTPPAAPAPAAQAPGDHANRPNAYVKETFTDWRIVCVKQPDDSDKESCTMQQLMVDTNDNPVSGVQVLPLPPAAAPNAAVVDIATPLETLLSGNLRFAIDTSPAKTYPFTYCLPDACHARFALSEEELAAMKAGAKATVTIVPLVARNQTVDIKMSLAGFTAAFDKMKELAGE